MDADTIKFAVPLLSGLLILTGGILSFLNGRLNEATTVEERQRVFFWLRQCLILTFGLIGAGLFHFGYFGFGFIPFSILYIIVIVEYLRSVVQGNAPPLYTATSLILISIYAAGFAFIGSISLANDWFIEESQAIGGLIELQEHTTAAQSRITDILEKLTSHSAEQSQLMKQIINLSSSTTKVQSQINDILEKWKSRSATGSPRRP